MDYQLPPPVTAQKKWAIKPEWLRLPKRKHGAKDKKVNAPTPAMQSLPDNDSNTPQPDIESTVLITEADVLGAVNIHTCFQKPSVAPDIKVTDLPNLEDVTEYGVSDEAQKKLWESEASRLVKVVTTSTPLEFLGSNDLAVDTKASYENLATLADQAWQAMNIALHDGENVLAEHAKDLCRENILRRSRRVLDYLCNKEEDTEDPDRTMSHVKQEDFFNFVDYCTAVLARVICAAVDGKSLHISVLAHLARISTKLKVVSAKPQEFSQTSIDNGVLDRNIPMPNHSGIRGRQEDSDGFPDMDSFLDSSLHKLGDLRAGSSGQREELVASSKKDSIRMLYFMQCAKYRASLFSLLRFLILSLRGTNNLTRTAVTSYEICAMVYETGFERFRTLVYQDHDNDCLGTSDTTNINCARSPFDLLDQTVRNICNRIGGTSASSNNGGDEKSPLTTHAATPGSAEGGVRDIHDESVGTGISWRYSPCQSDSEKLERPPQHKLGSMSHVITVMIPLIMTSPVAIYGIGSFIDMAIFTETTTERQVHPIKPRSYGKYTAFFCLTTKEYSDVQERRKENEAKSLSNALMRRNNLHLGKRITDIGRAKTNLHELSEHSHTLNEEDNPTFQQHRRELESVNDKMKSWVFEEKGVMVRCKTYVCTVMFFCVLLVAGSVVAGVTVGQRISGVDPFNITTYCWVLAAFIVLVAKSVRVQDWPWNDFLHGRVLCKSVSELSSVTGIGDQLILAKLLQDESISFLQTRGPYNTVFRRTSEDGFSIDRPLSSWTMLLSGLIMIEVEFPRGRGIVCLDLRRGTKYGLIKNICDREDISDTELIHSNRLPENKDPDSHTHGLPNKIRLVKGNMAWLRSRGFYGNKYAEFT